MDRKIVYPGAIPLEDDLLQTNRFAMVGVAKLASAIMGTSTYLHGLECRPAQPASLHVTVAAGEIYSLQNVDGTTYSSLDADTHSILKQGILADGVTLPLTAPNTAGFSVNYLVQVAYQDVDTESAVLPYYNASNPTQAWHGPNNSGSAQGTVRAGVCSVSIKAGVAATTGTQTTPGVDTGHVAAYVVTVKSGQTSVTAADIALAGSASFLPTDGLVVGIQSGVMNYAPDHGQANVYMAEYCPPVTGLVDGLKLTFKANSANSGTSTFSPNGLAAAPIYSNVHTALKGGEILATGLVEVEWNSTFNAWVLVNTNLASISEGLVRSVNTHKPDASGDVKLGTAADADVQTSQSDTTPGRLIPFGNYGLAPSLPAATGVDLNTLQTYGLYIVSNVKNGPFNGDIGAMFIYVSTWQSGTGTAGYRITQEAIGYGQSASTANRVARRSFNGTVWTGWQEFYSEAHKPTAVDINAADVRNNFAARMGVARVISGTNKPSSPGIWSVENSTWTPYPYGTLFVTTNNADLSATSGDGKFIHYLFIAHGEANKFYVATEVNGSFVGWESYLSKKGGPLTGPLNVDAKISLSDGLELGNQKAPSPAYIDFHTDGAATDYNARIISPQGTTEIQLIAADSANNGSGIIRLLGNKGDQLSFALQGTARQGLAWRKWGSDDRPTVLELDVDGGIWLISVDHTKDDKAALGVNGVVSCEGVNVGNARMAADGNIWGTCWGGDYLSNYLNNNFSKKTDAIEDIQLGAQYTVPYQPIAQSGGVLTGLRDSGQTYYCRPIQKKINGTWYTVGQV